MACGFFGHRDAPDEIRGEVLLAIDKLIVYYRHRFSHCEKWVAKARRRRIRMIEV